MHIWGQTVVNLIVEQVAALLTYQDELLNMAKLLFNASRQGFSYACRTEMLRATSRLLVLLVGIGAGRGFGGVGAVVIGQFCVGDRNASVGKMVGLGGDLRGKPGGGGVRRVLMVHETRE